MSPAAQASDDPFAATLHAPADVTMYVHVAEGARLRARLGDRPILSWLGALIGQSDVARSWDGLARASGVDPVRLFDSVLGRRVSLFIRRGADTRPPLEWALLVEVEPDELQETLLRLRPRRLAPEHGVAMAALPEQELLLGSSGRLLLIGSAQQPLLFRHILPTLSGVNKHSLSAEPALRRARQELGKGAIAVYMRHEPPLGGWSAIVGEVRGDDLVVHQIGDFDTAPLRRPVTRTRTDFSILSSFERDALVALAQPRDIGESEAEQFVAAALDEAIIDETIRPLLGPRRLLVIGEEEGRLQADPVDLLTTSYAICLEVSEPEGALARFDRKIVRLARGFGGLLDGEGAIDVPELDALGPGEPRHVDVSGATARFFGGLPLMKSLSLNWTLVRGAEEAGGAAHWFVLATHRGHLDDVVKALRRPATPSTWRRGAFDHCGTFSGMRLGRHLSSWGERPELLADPDAIDQFRRTMMMVSGLADAVERCEWNLARPSANQTRLEVRVKLAPSRSSDSGR